MEVNYQAAQFYLNAFNILATFLLAFYVFVSNRRKATVAHMVEQDRRLSAMESTLLQHQPKEVHKELRELDTRLTELGVSVRHLPHDADIVKVHERIDSLTASVSHMQGQLGQINNNVHLISDYLMKK